MSLDRMIGHECNRKDDLESIVLLLIFLIKGKLPWSSDVARYHGVDNQADEHSYSTASENSWNKEKKENIPENKVKLNSLISKMEQKDDILQKMLAKIDNMPIEDICKGIPVELRKLLTKCR